MSTGFNALKFLTAPLFFVLLVFQRLMAENLQGVPKFRFLLSLSLVFFLNTPFYSYAVPTDEAEGLPCVVKSNDVLSCRARDKKHNVYLSYGSVTGGEITDGKDIYRIRWGKHSTFERIVFDIHYGDSEEDYGPVDVPCYFEIRYVPSRLKFEVDFSGAREASATIPILARSRLISYIDFRNLYGDSSVGYVIKLKRPVKFEVFELHNPARVVIDIKRRH